MDRVDHYRDLIRKIMTEHAEIPFPIGQLECKTVFDRDKDSYILVTVGWHNGERIYHVVTHVDVIDGKLWVQHDVTEDGIATELVSQPSRAICPNAVLSSPPDSELAQLAQPGCVSEQDAGSR